MNERTRRLALAAAFSVQLIYGVTFTFANDVIDGAYIKPYGFILLRISCTTALLWLLSLFLPTQKIDRKDFGLLFLASIFGIALNMLTFFKGLEYTTPIHASVIMTVVPIIVMVLSSFFLKEAITRIKIIGIIIGFAGAIVLTVYGKSNMVGDNIVLGNVLVLINAISYSFYVIIVKKLTDKYHPFAFIKWLFLFGLILVLPFGFTELMTVEIETFTPYISFSVMFIIIGSTFLTYILNPLALSKLKASTVSIFLYIQPVIAGTFAIMMGSDSINFIKIIAVGLIFTGVFLVTKKSKELV